MSKPSIHTTKVPKLAPATHQVLVIPRADYASTCADFPLAARKVLANLQRAAEALVAEEVRHSPALAAVDLRALEALALAYGGVGGMGGAHTVRSGRCGSLVLLADAAWSCRHVARGPATCVIGRCCVASLPCGSRVVHTTRRALRVACVIDQQCVALARWMCP